MTGAATPTCDRLVALSKAATLVEALPWLARFHGAVQVTGRGIGRVLAGEMNGTLGHPLDAVKCRVLTGFQK